VFQTFPFQGACRCAACASFQALNIHFISATVPAGAITGPVTVANVSGIAASAKTFTVN
jgi:hypothetical protein